MPNPKSSRRAVATKLARVGDPYVMPDGSRIHPEGLYVDVEADQPKLSTRTFKPTQRRAIKELPADTGVLNAVACVFMYTVLGIGEREIAAAIKTTTDDVKKIKAHPAYGECFDGVVEEFINANSDLIQSRLAAYAHPVLSRVADIALNGKQETNALRASTDLLDRGGFAKRDVSKGPSGMDDLRIIVTKGDATVQVDVSGSNQGGYNG